jgi:SOS-response transcriptional repressor LexA
MTRPARNQLYNRAGVAKRQQILDFIGCYQSNHGSPPSYREIGAEVGLLSSSTVSSHVQKLIAAGHLRQRPGQPRSLELTTPPDTLARRILAMVDQALDDVVSVGTESDALELAESALRQLAEFLRQLP